MYRGEKSQLGKKDTGCILWSEFDYFSSSICKLYSKPNWRKASICTGWWCAKAQRGCWDLLLIHSFVFSDAATFLCVFSTRFVFHPLYVFRQSLCIHEGRTQHSEALQKLQQRAADVRHHISLPRNMQAGWMQHKIGTWSYSLCPAFRVYLLKEENATKTVYLANIKKKTKAPLKVHCRKVLHQPSNPHVLQTPWKKL